MRTEMARGAAWMVLFRLFDRSIGIVSTAVLARMLVPADFGLVAMAMSVIAVIELATAFSFEIALIQKADPQREHFDTAWTLNILVAGGGALVTAALAWPAASLYGDARLVPVMLCIALAWFVSGFENTGIANFRRRMDFAAEFRFMATKRVITFLVTMVAAVSLRSYWALVIGMATGRLVGVSLSYVLEPMRPRLSLQRTRDLMSFSGWLLLNNIVGVLLARVPHFFIGRVFGAQGLGTYTVGAEIAQLAHTELVAPINRAMFPGYARLVDDLPAFRRVCIEASAVILLVVMPISFAVAVFADPIVRVLLGAQWREAVPIIQVLAFAGAATALTSNNSAAYVGLGRPNLVSWLLSVRLIVFVVAVWAWTAERNLMTVAYAELLAAAAGLLVSVPLLARVVGVAVADYLGVVWRPLLASAVGAGVVLWCAPPAAAASVGQALMLLALGLPAGALVYLAVLVLLWWLSGRPHSMEAVLATKAVQAVRARWAALSERRT